VEKFGEPLNSLATGWTAWRPTQWFDDPPNGTTTHSMAWWAIQWLGDIFNGLATHLMTWQTNFLLRPRYSYAVPACQARDIMFGRQQNDINFYGSRSNSLNRLNVCNTAHHRALDDTLFSTLIELQNNERLRSDSASLDVCCRILILRSDLSIDSSAERPFKYVE